MTARMPQATGSDLLYRRIALRIIPLLFLGYVVAFLDRVNIGFAKLQMAGDLKFSDAVYGLGAGIFFVGYFVFEVPSNLAMVRVGARRWMARIMISWGLLSTAFMFVGELKWGGLAGLLGLTDAEFGFYLLRFLLGAAGPHRDRAGRGLRVRRQALEVAHCHRQGHHRQPVERPAVLRPGRAEEEAMKPLRCAVYTRKSTEDGLEQEFNSLDAQREACEAYILSQRHEGWTLVPGRYDDGGYSGGNMERPGLKALMAEIDAGQIDVIVVYKVDTGKLRGWLRIVRRC